MTDHSSLNTNKHIYTWAGVSFIMAAAAFVGSMMFPFDTTTDPPTISEGMMRLGQIQTALIILGSTVLGIKYAEEKSTMAAIAFTMYGIAQGVVFVVYIISYNSHANLEEGYAIFSASLFLLLPAALLIALYSDLPLWLRILTFVSVIPYAIENVSFEIDHVFDKQKMIIDAIGNTTNSFVTLCWGIIYLKRAKQAVPENIN